MICFRARRLFGAYWDDETTQAEREWLEAHFAACPRCRNEYEETARALELLAELPRIEVAPDLAERALARARRAHVAPDRMPAAALGWVPATAAAVALLLIAGTLLTPWLAALPHGPRDPRALASAPVRVPELVSRPAAGGPHASARRGAVRPPEGDRVLAGIPDSLFDHSEDVEFILDPVTLRRGWPAVSQPLPAVQGRQATITF